LSAQRVIYIKHGKVDRVLDLEDNAQDRAWVIKQSELEGFGEI